MFGSLGGGATWAEGVYEIQYAKVNGVWKISRLDYHSGFGAPYATGWVPPAAPGANAGAGGAPRTAAAANGNTTPGSAPSAPNPGATPGTAPASGAIASAPAAAPARPRRVLPHPADRERNDPCDAFSACVAPFHYENPGTSLAGGSAWNTESMLASVKAKGGDAIRAANLAHRASLLKAEQDIENLQRIYGYYIDRAMWDQAADLFADNGTLEVGQQGVYVGKKRVRDYLGLQGPHGLVEGWLNDHMQLQPIVDVAPDGNTARIRSRELAMTGKVGGQGFWSEGIYENTFVKDNGVWKIQSLHFYPTFITDYDKGWGKDAQPVPTASTQLPPDRPPTEVYAIYPKPHVPPFHYRNPVTGKASTYPSETDGGPSKQLAAAALMPERRRYTPPKVSDVDAAVSEAQRIVGRVKDFHELDNLESAYGYYLDKNLWNDLANLFASDGSIELAQRGVYKGKRVREFLVQVFGRGKEGPVAGRLGNHVQMQPVIHVADDGKRAKIRLRMMQQMSFGPRASMGGSVYENEAIKEDGVWKFSKVHTFNTFTANYEGGWTKVTASNVPGPSKEFPPDSPPTLVFDMFPSVYNIAFHYANPVTGRTELPPIKENTRLQARMAAAAGAPPGMSPQIALALRDIGPKIEGRRTAELYAPLHPKEPYTNVTLTRDVSYGPHERHVLDVFVSPDTTAKSRKPVVVFIHGGGFAGGAKRTPGSPFYDNVGLWAASHGLVGVTINYRLAPQFPYPAGVEDLTRLTAWLKKNIKSHGGDPNKVFFWGHSAGAAHAADYIASVTNAGKKPGIAGAILTSGFYVLGDEVSVWKAYYGEDVSKYKERSSLPGLVKSKVPLLVVDAELDPDTFKPESDRLADERAKVGRPVTRVKLAGHSHISELYAVNTSDESHSAPVLKFVQDLSAKKKP
jgi:triacylglycerol lipase